MMWDSEAKILTTGLRLGPQEIFDLIGEDLRKVEKALEQQSVSSVEPINKIGNYLRQGGGKRVRPALVLLAGRFCGYQGHSAYQLGAVVELIHSATLVHDDIVDNADTRRGRSSTNARWGNSMSVLAGDWLYMQAFRVALAERNLEILDRLIDLTQAMVEGEMIQLTLLADMGITEEQHLDLIYRKTALLFSTSMRLGAMVAGSDESTEEQLEQYGRNLGMAFQLVDDLLDYSASAEQLGKPVGKDILEGKVTLPLILLLQRCRAEEAERISRVLQEKSYEALPWVELRNLMAEHGTMDDARSKARAYAEQAKACLDSFPDSIYKQALLSLPDFVLEREY